MELYTYPSQAELKTAMERTPAHMHPNMLPFAFVGKGYLSDEECDAMIHQAELEQSYNFHGCATHTRDIPRPLHSVYNPLVEFARQANAYNWQYDLETSESAWFQTYQDGSDYPKHTDTAPGQNRKLTAVVLLSSAEEYSGGDLVLHTTPFRYTITHTRGTIVAFQPWIPHSVTPIVSGTRKTINLGLYGPAFK